MHSQQSLPNTIAGFKLQALPWVRTYMYPLSLCLFTNPTDCPLENCLLISFPNCFLQCLSAPWIDIVLLRKVERMLCIATNLCLAYMQMHAYSKSMSVKTCVQFWENLTAGNIQLTTVWSSRHVSQSGGAKCFASLQLTK